MPKARSSYEIHKQLALLSQMVEDISGEIALEPPLARMVESACGLIGADDDVIGLYLPERDVIRIEASHNIPGHEMRPEMPRGEGLTGRVLELDEPIRGYCHDLPHAERPRTRTSSACRSACAAG